jgi:hypothetical protein
MTTLIGGFLGLTFAARYADFQERPRPQFLRPAAMMVAVFLGVALIFGIAIPSLFWVLGVAPASDWPPFAIAMGLGLGIVALTFRMAQTGTKRLLQALPI